MDAIVTIDTIDAMVTIDAIDAMVTIDVYVTCHSEKCDCKLQTEN